MNQPQTPQAQSSPAKAPKTSLPPLTLPALPPELSTPLKGRDRRLVLALVAGDPWQAACDAAKLPLDHPYRAGPPQRIRQAADYIIRELMTKAGASRQWITTELVGLYQRSLDDVRSLSTARGCLFLLGVDLGMFGKAASGIPAGEVAELMRAVADRGRRARPAILDALQQQEKTVVDQ